MSKSPSDRSGFRLRMDAALSLLLFACAVAVLVAVPPPVPAAADGHVALNGDTDTCAQCHRSHSSASSSWFRQSSSASTTGTALIVGTASTDEELCYTCHGAASEGSRHDVQSEFTRSYRHALAPSASAFGPSPKQCSDCHDSHGTDRTAGGASYPALLRSRSAANTLYFSGEAYCGACHSARPASRFSSVGVFSQTAHYSSIPTPTSGTAIRCSVCHAPHGSNNSALITAQLEPPAVSSTVTVPANDRRFCLGCHSSGKGTYEGAAAYAGSAHAASTASVPVAAEYASAEATRLVGECQVCHDAMGRDDGAGKPMPRLLDAMEPSLCYRCHRTAGPASKDMLAISYAPTSTPLGDLIAAYGPPVMSSSYGRIAVYAQDSAASAVPRGLIGPREYRPGGTVGRIAAGDLNGDGRTEVVVADPGVARLTVLQQEGSRGLAPGGTYAIAAPANAIAVGDIFGNADTQRPVIAVATGTTAGKLYLYRLGDEGTIVQLGEAIDIGDGPYSIAVGDVRGSSAPDLVVSAHGSDQFVVVSDSGAPDVPSVTGPYGTASGPVAVSIGNVWTGQSPAQIAVAADGGGGTLSIMKGDGTTLGTYGAGGIAGAAVQDCLVGDALPGFPGNEIVVALGGPNNGGLLVFPSDPAGGLLAARTYSIPPHYAPGRLALGDVDGDGKQEVVVGNGGQPSSAPVPASPSIQVFSATSDGMDLASSQTYAGGGTELAGSAPDVLVEPLPLVGPSRHPMDQAPAASHVSTETAPFARHATCSDCHDSHAATDATSTAPLVSGPLVGAQGVTVSNSSGSVILTGPRTAEYEYEVCLKCHSAYPGPLSGRRDVALDFNTYNASFHGVEATPTGSSASPGSFVPRGPGLPGWTNESWLRCSDCHGNAAPGAPSGPHVSGDAPILDAPYLGIAPSEGTGFCYRCHQYDVYYTGLSDSGGALSNFYSSTPPIPTLHAQHMRTYGLGCDACHVSHGSATEPHLLRDDIGFSSQPNGGTCTNACHTSPGIQSYTR